MLRVAHLLRRHAAGFNPRAFLAPMALGGKLPEPAETRQPKENNEPEA